MVILYSNWTLMTNNLNHTVVVLKPGVFQLDFTRKTPGFKQSEV